MFQPLIIVTLASVVVVDKWQSGTDAMLFGPGKYCSREKAQRSSFSELQMEMIKKCLILSISVFNLESTRCDLINTFSIQYSRVTYKRLGVESLNTLYGAGEWCLKGNAILFLFPSMEGIILKYPSCYMLFLSEELWKFLSCCQSSVTEKGTQQTAHTG